MLTHYLQKTCSTGSTLYYSLLYQRGKKREAMILIEAFYQAIIEIKEKVSETSVALAKLQWWRNEIEKLYQQQATHPIAQALQPHIKDFNLSKNYFLAIIDAMFDHLQQPEFENEKTEYTFYCRTAGSKELLKLSLIKKISADDIKLIYPAAAGIALAKITHKRNNYLTNLAKLPQHLRIEANIVLKSLQKKNHRLSALIKLFIAWTQPS